MNLYRDLITVSRELARVAREKGIVIPSLNVLDAARAAEAQLARDENELDTLRQTVRELRRGDGGNPLVALRAALREAFAHLDAWEARQNEREAQVLREAEEFHGRGR